MKENQGWKWATLILAVMLLAMLSCLVGAWFGGLSGLILGMRLGRDVRAPSMGPWEYPITPRPELPELPTIPAPEGRPWLGVTFITTEEGAEIVEVVPGSPAAEADLRVGDVITAVEGQAVTRIRPLSEHIARYAPGQRVQLTYLRDGQEFSVRVRLGSRPLEFPGSPSTPFILPPAG